MDPRLLQAYNDELVYLRESAREFGNEHDQAAAFLGPKFPDEPDPYVERLLEGVAFLAARVKLKLDDQFPEFTQHLLQAIQPSYVAPTPSMAVAAFEPESADPALAAGRKIARLTEVSAKVPTEETPCRFKTGQEVELWPIQIAEADYLPSRAAAAPYAGPLGLRAEAGVRLVIEATGPADLSQLPIERLPLYITGSESIPGELYRQLMGDCVAVAAGSGGSGWIKLPPPRAYGFSDDCALLPNDRRSFRGYRILSEYFACPEKFRFAELTELRRVLPGCARRCEVVFLLKRQVPALVGAVTQENLRPFCSPIINLFEMQLGRTPITPFAHEHQILPDRTRPLDYEVFSVLEATAHDRAGKARKLAPLYEFGSLLFDWKEALFYVTRLKLRRLSTKEQRLRRRNEYLGTETWMSITAPGSPERLDTLSEVAVRALVTNRELPEMLRMSGKNNEMQMAAAEGAVRRVVVLRPPTRPRTPLGIADAAWRVIAHLTPNYASLLAPGVDGPAVLRDHLALYGRNDDPVMRRQVDGVLALSSRPVMRRLPDEADGTGPSHPIFARGLQVKIKLDDAAFESGSMFLFSAVLHHFLSEFASINTFIETAFESPDQGDIAKWPASLGSRPTI
jgi:type VI secretion system protein ImpG